MNDEFPFFAEGRGEPRVPVSLEKLIVCTCRHTVDYHGDTGCEARKGLESTTPCQCILRPREVVDRIIALELEATRMRWLGVLGTTNPPSEQRAD